jgi:hypothetical protein
VEERINVGTPTPTAATEQPGAAGGARLLLVTGPGRSGTSAVTGALSQLGIHVPPPLVDWNRSNKKGFFETRWVVDFQRNALRRARTYEFDADPRAMARLEDLNDDSIQTDLTEWLKGASAGHEQIVVKDPRSVWLHPWWSRAAQDNGLVLSYLTMLRHPTEVVGSRSTYYGKFADERDARDYGISKVAGWVNVSLLNERMTRNQPRVFLRYTDLLADWRRAMTTVADQVSLTYNADLNSGEPNPVDEFITPSLHRIRTGWDELDVPDELRQIADGVWEACERVADQSFDDDLGRTFDELTERYSRLYRDAVALSSDTTTMAVATARAEAVRRTRREMQAKINAAKKAATAAQQTATKPSPQTKATKKPSGGNSVTQKLPTPLRKAGSYGRRAVRKVRRRLAR